MAENLKSERGIKKGQVTRVLNSMRKSVAEEDEAKVKELLDKLKENFDVFEAVHERYHDSLADETEWEQSDQYFFSIQDKYIDCLDSTKAWLRGRNAEANATTPKAEVGVTDVKPGVSQLDMFSAVNLPKVELEVFDGDPVKFRAFMTVFDELVDKVAINDKMKLTRLLSATSGDARKAISSCIFIEGSLGYMKAREILQNRFGNDHLVTERMIHSLRHGKAVKSARELQQLSDELNCCFMTLDQMGHLQELESQVCMVEIVNRLQPYLQNRWKKKALDLKHESKQYPKFQELVDFINREACDANDPVYGKVGLKAKSEDGKKGNSISSAHVKQSVSFSSNVKGSYSKWKRPPCKLCNNDHRLLYCPTFKLMKLTERVKYVRDHKLCENCLLDNHGTEECRKQSVCDVRDCGKRHTRYLHVDCNELEDKDSTNKGRAVNVHNVNVDGEVFMPIVRVVVNDCSTGSALLDTASSNTFCSRSLVDKVALRSERVRYSLSTLTKCEERESDIVSFTVSSLDGRESLHLSHVYVVDDIPVRSSPVQCREFPHLKGLDISGATGKVEILIGQDHAEALIPLEVKKGRKGEPFAVRSIFGWSINGPAKVLNTVSPKVVSHFVRTDFLEEKVNSLWNLENDGISGDVCTYSQNELQVIQLWEKRCRKVNDHYELPIPWKPNVCLPNNMGVALRRLESLRVSLVKRGLMEKYNSEVKSLLAKGYAEAAPPLPYVSSAKVWYLPHQCVVSDKKPDKIRIVFDCASKFQGQSLNSNCFQGPDMNNRLLSVMLRFREHTYAVMADIEGMYHQVLVPDADRDALRFLWWDDAGEICHYRMTRHLFGGVWCSSSSTFALRRILVDNPDVDPVVADTIRYSFYVDDCLKSVASKSDALRVVHGTKSVLSEAGFNLTKFVSNEASLLEEISDCDRAKEVKDFSSPVKCKALGVKWDVVSDSFYFDAVLQPSSPITRRHMLSFIASIFDPLGLISPVVIAGKMLFQEATRLKLEWDSVAPGNLCSRWEAWVRDLGLLCRLKFPRCVKPAEFDDAHLELHHFSDASSKGYGCCSYLRCVDKAGRIHVSLLLSKSKLAPLKSTTIPRLELQAAVLSARVDSMLRNELSLHLAPSYFWVDSQIVLKYIHNEDKQFHVFVANRVNEIRNLTSVGQWHHISGKDNISDCISRGSSVRSFDFGRWVSGPAFLHEYKSTWKLDTEGARDFSLSEDDEEVKRDSVKRRNVCLMNDVEVDPMEKLFSYYSSWYRLKRAVAWLLKFKNHLRFKCHDGMRVPLSVEDLEESETYILKYVQNRMYSKELKSLSSGVTVSKDSSVRGLDPFVDSDGLLRVGGRIKGSNLVYDAKHPILVPHNHPIAVLIVRECHERAHVGIEWTVNELRKKYWITRIRRVVKNLSRNCFKCRRYFGSTCVQKMSDLPPQRLDSGNPPFHYVGIDCFGPFLVKRGRAEVKRYGCLFTCLNTRAVHLEKLENMDVDSFLNGFRRFVSRRGSPVEVWSDNGPNFVGGNLEMSRCFDELQQKSIYDKAIQKGVIWHFNPPCASHMGGLWERMIRTVRKVLVGLIGLDARLTDESLDTLLCEVEQMVNSRPITKVSDDANDPHALTPNHLLLLREHPSFPPGEFRASDVYKRRWRCVQHLGNVFWKRWLSDYLPELQRRSKWLKIRESLAIGDLVLILNENTPRGLWPLGVVVEVFPSKDGLIRSVKVRTKVTELVRPISKIVFLEGCH